MPVHTKLIRAVPRLLAVAGIRLKSSYCLWEKNKGESQILVNLQKVVRQNHYRNVPIRSCCRFMKFKSRRSLSSLGKRRGNCAPTTVVGQAVVHDRRRSLECVFAVESTLQGYNIPVMC